MIVYLLVRVEPGHPGSLVRRGDVISIRPEGARITEFEKKNLLVLKVPVSEETKKIWTDKVRLQSTTIPTHPPKSDKIKDRAAAFLQFEDYRQALPPYGLKVDIDDPITGFSSSLKKKIDDNKRVLEPVEVDPAIVQYRG